MVEEILLEGDAEGDRLRLAGVGSWTATRARRLEALITRVVHARAPVSRVDIDMSRVERLDTYGALLLERIEHEFKARGAATNVTGPQRGSSHAARQAARLAAGRGAAA